MSGMELSMVVPVLNEARHIEAALTALSPFRARGAELIVVDGGSNDGTPDIAASLVDHIIVAPRGRATQMNAGAAVARGKTLVFLHADTRLPANADTLMRDHLAHSSRLWGRFDVRFDRGGWMPLIAFMMNLRSRLTGIATGDQAIFVSRSAFDAVGGFPPLALMEDIAFSARLKRLSRPVCIDVPVVTSARRWRDRGTLRTVILMWRLRFAYFLGADPAHLARRYGYASTD